MNSSQNRIVRFLLDVCAASRALYKTGQGNLNFQPDVWDYNIGDFYPKRS